MRESRRGQAYLKKYFCLRLLSWRVSRKKWTSSRSPGFPQILGRTSQTRRCVTNPRVVVTPLPATRTRPRSRRMATSVSVVQSVRSSSSSFTRSASRHRTDALCAPLWCETTAGCQAAPNKKGIQWIPSAFLFYLIFCNASFKSCSLVLPLSFNFFTISLATFAGYPSATKPLMTSDNTSD